MKKTPKPVELEEPDSEDEELSMGGWVADHMDSLQEEQDEWNASEARQAKRAWVERMRKAHGLTAEDPAKHK
jgi:hypothetical protein